MCERVEDVYVVFQSLPERNSVFMLNWVIVRLVWIYRRCQKSDSWCCSYPRLVTWNSLLATYCVHNKEAIAFKLVMDRQGFGLELDVYTYTSVISACFDEAHIKHGKSLHGLVIKRGLEKSVPISNALISMYLKSKNRRMEDALLIFDTMELKDRDSWNPILTGFLQLGFKMPGNSWGMNSGINPGILIAATHYQISGYARTAAWIVLDLIRLGAIFYAIICPKPPPCATSEQIRIFEEVIATLVLRNRASIRGNSMRSTEHF
uniref:Pentatricopeptide repeat-containing protein n=1 Tax=Quercus lobata TaxID=97700 RepID=A0A7N2R5K2_QUELO